MPAGTCIPRVDRRTVTFMRVAAVLLGLVLGASGTSVASADSIVFERDGEVWAAAPDGSRQTKITTGGFVRPAQSDDGTIVAVKDGLLHRIDRTGRVLNSAGTRENADPLYPSFRADGGMIAYGAFRQTDPGAGFRTRLSFPDRETSTAEAFSITGWNNPSWIGTDRVLMFDAGSSSDDTLIKTLGPAPTEVWFDDPEVELSGGEVNAQATKLAATTGGGASIRLYRLPAPPPALPEKRCDLTGPNGSAFRPSWSPDGTSLAWQEDDGIHVGSFNLDSGDCAGSERLVIPGGRAPDWGPADVPVIAVPGGPAPGPGGGDAGGGGIRPGTDSVKPKLTLLVKKRLRRRALLRGVTVRVTCDEPCRAVGELRAKGRGRIARKAKRLTVAGTVKLKLRPAARMRRKLRRGKLSKVTLRVRATDLAGNATTVKRTLRVRR